ncbi:MAG TPA: subclass B3 metallo-beta-lactamase [Bryobacteraceae bacterium]|nr:subclass B3 metallo-beta-lactamase [Bryobacteraceae bacterium]
MRRCLLLLAALPALAGAQRIFPPLRIIGNLYYVGDNDLASYLIVTPKGDILINTGYEYSVPEIRSRVSTLGFKFADIKILLVTHAHSDHAAGEAAVKRLTGAKMLAMEEEVPLLETGGKTDYLFGNSGWFPPVKVDRALKDGEKIELGGTELTAHLHPGHTKGSASYSMEVAENGKTYHVLIANLGNINDGTVLLHNPKYPKIVEDYARTFQAQKELPCDIFLTSHAGQFGLLRKWQPGDPYDPNRFVDPEGYARAVERAEDRFLEQLQEERDEEQAWKDHLKFKDVIPQQF